ncbi:DDE-type integrase/transposase/recombinase [Geoalkalibacter halelectricus]|uniref:DDE-type integrase/transposase/recombinase n=1 Tax=Geoalkalibacter halelectricus TaxID=2847045 RepID=A0ABY5ZLJ6_9BACT|nr:DDE-type integrase/transposase/recombinase [Geoalkalibacter halelectricus]MDO3377066.1 DDE-type integrase/transposase/recombinase [Geoalkalibacter halelectricus]MDO3377129.1 DDE-type integrase/transposase/recombinase [Geoalkalibacter halelectricus]UWZ79719.1 DDE-type integrase/transposase/recombinase [Geoalkalibacter halelectricus]
MTDKEREDVALFRFGVISDLVGATRLEHGERSRRIKQKAAVRWNIPHSTRTRICDNTIRRWVSIYEKSGRQLDALKPVPRSDIGCCRQVDEDTVLSLVRLRKAKPLLPVAHLIEEMEKKGLVSPGYTLRLSTAYRVLKKAGLSGRPGSDPVDRRRFEAEFPNDIWQSDVMHGPHVLVDGKKRKSYLIAFLDDHSRLITQARFMLSENLASFLKVYRAALTTRGLPRKLYVDNGSAFRSRHLEKVCACLGIAITHTPPYTPQGRGKIERFFRTVRSQLLAALAAETLEDLNQALDHWIQQSYHRRPHSSTGQPPLERFASHLELIRKPPIDLDDHFRKEVRRRVNKDRSVSIDGRCFEAPTRLIGEQVSLLFHEETPTRVEIVLRGEPQGFLVPLDPHINAAVGRDQNNKTSETGVQQGQLSFAKGEQTP